MHNRASLIIGLLSVYSVICYIQKSVVIACLLQPSSSLHKVVILALYSLFSVCLKNTHDVLCSLAYTFYGVRYMT
jgi:hypothetical protein